MDKRIIIGISGASGAPLAVELLKKLKFNFPQIERHVVITQGGQMTLLQECNMSDVEELSTVIYNNQNIGASIASGSYKTMGMIIIPCSMKTVAGIVSGYSDNLLLRAADVCLKERRKLVLVARESPLSTIHLKNMYDVSRFGAIVIPPMLTYYNHPESIQDMTNHVVNRVLSQFDLDVDSYSWGGL